MNKRRTIHHRKRGPLWGAAFVLLPIAVRAQPQDLLGLAGNDQLLWLYAGTPNEDGIMLVQFAYRGASESSGGRFRLLPLPKITGHIVRAAARGTNLHVIFSDGTHRRYTPTGSMWAATPPSVSFDELTLPDAAVPLALTADGPRDCLYAIVPAAIAERLPAGDEAAEKEGDSVSRESVDGIAKEAPGALRPRAEGSQSPVGHSSSPVILPVPPATDLSIVRYEFGRWRRDRQAPAELTLSGPRASARADADEEAGVRILALLASDGVIHILARTAVDKTVWRHFISRGADEKWLSPEGGPLRHDRDMPGSSSTVVVASGWGDGTPVLILREGSPESGTLRSLRFADGAWSTGTQLVDAASNPVTLTVPFSASLFKNSVALAHRDDSGDPQVGLWSLGGTPIEPMTTVAPLQRRAAPLLSPGARLVVQYVVLALVLAVVFVRRRSTVLGPVALEPGQALAMFSRRAAALSLDLVILSPVWVPMMYQFWRSGARGLTPAEQLELGAGAIPPMMFWAWAMLGAVVAIYATVFEAATATTPGKRILGCSVVREGGGRCSFGTIVVRNVTRILEFHFLPLALLVFLTPGRQRLGDLLARTVVLERTTTITPASGSSGPPEDDSDSHTS